MATEILEGKIKVLNWNIAGAKYLELKSRDSAAKPSEDKTREAFHQRLNAALVKLVEDHNPDVVTLQEVVEYEPNGKVEHRTAVINELQDYHYFPHMLIDTLRHSHQGKWNKVKEMGEWPESAFFAQGNAILIHKRRMAHFPIWSLPNVAEDHALWVGSKLPRRQNDAPGLGCMEVVTLDSGLYFGDRNTEPRAALVTHFVIDELDAESLSKPLDIFVINLHLTTLAKEREGIPEIDARAEQTRLRQLDIVLNGIVSQYNEWRKDGFKIRGEHIKAKDNETYERHAPIWIIAGDFNFTREATEYQSILRRGFIDLIPNHQIGTKTSGLGKDPTLTVDYVFAGPRFEAIDPVFAAQKTATNHVEVTDKMRVSDHFPLIVDVPIALPMSFRRGGKVVL